MRNSSKNSLKIFLGIFLTFSVLLPVVFSDHRHADAGILVDRIVAVVGKDVVTQSDLDRLLQSRKGFEKSKEKPDHWVILHQLIEERLIVHEAGKRGIRVSDEEIEFALKDIETRNNFPDRASFKQAVSMENIPWDQYVTNLKNQLLTLKLLSREINSKLKLSDEEIQAYYDSYSERFQLPDRVRIRQILLKFSPDTTDATKKTLRERAEKIYYDLHEGEDFIQLFRQHSASSAKNREGDLGFFRKGELAEKIEEAVFGLQEGEVSPPIENERGLHLFKVEEKETDRWIPFEKVRRDIEEKLLMEKRAALRKKWMDDLWEKSFVEIKK